MRGTKESSSCHSLFKAGSDKALQVRANLESALRPLSSRRMASNSLSVASGSDKMVRTMICG
jgi:hypothetical protein